MHIQSAKGLEGQGEKTCRTYSVTILEFLVLRIFGFWSLLGSENIHKSLKINLGEESICYA